MSTTPGPVAEVSLQEGPSPPTEQASTLEDVSLSAAPPAVPSEPSVSTPERATGSRPSTTADGSNSSFYPPSDQTPRIGSPSGADDPTSPSTAASSTRSSPNRPGSQNLVQQFERQEEDDKNYVSHFWRAYDDIIILSLFTQIGIVFRLASSTWFTFFDNVFSSGSALFVVLPLNCLSCFLMGMLSSGDRLMEIVTTRFTPPRLQQYIQRQHEDTLVEEEEGPDDDDGIGVAIDTEGVGGHDMRPPSTDGLMRGGVTSSRRGLRKRRKKKRRGKTQKYFHSWQPPVNLDQEMRDLQLLAVERRIRASKCLLLFPVKKEDVDVMEHYFYDGYKKDDEDDEEAGIGAGDSLRQPPNTMIASGPGPSTTPPPITPESFDLALTEEGAVNPPSSPERVSSSDVVSTPGTAATSEQQDGSNSTDEPVANGGENVFPGHNDLDQMFTDVTTNVHENISRLRRVNLADGWDVGTTPEAMADDLLLGLRDGFCGALSSFSSWNSAMVNLMEDNKFGEAFVGYMLGLQLPIIAYRFGQHVAVYVFIWRCKYESSRDRRRGYGIRVDQHEDSERDAGPDGVLANEPQKPTYELPSLRALITAVFILALVTQCTSLSFFANQENQQLALSLLFSPLGVLARWRLSKYNYWKPGFPIGTFTANILACALSGSLGKILAGNPGPRESIVLVSIVAGFGGTMSSLATFIVEVLAGIDPILFRFDGVIYACFSIFWAMVAGFVFSASVDWADQTTTE